MVVPFIVIPEKDCAWIVAADINPAPSPTNTSVEADTVPETDNS